MKTIFPSILAAVMFWLAANSHAQEASSASQPSGPENKELSPRQGAEKPVANLEELEAKFKAALTKAIFNGRWCSIKDGQLGPNQEDKYTIQSATKILADTWLINARIQYGKRDFVVPVPVKVKWAGDTPVIVVDNFGIPGGSSYSARVLVYNNTYAGTWSGGDHGGLLNGVITHEKE